VSSLAVYYSIFTSLANGCAVVDCCLLCLVYLSASYSFYLASPRSTYFYMCYHRVCLLHFSALDFSLILFAIRALFLCLCNSFFDRMYTLSRAPCRNSSLSSGCVITNVHAHAYSTWPFVTAQSYTIRSRLPASWFLAVIAPPSACSSDPTVSFAEGSVPQTRRPCRMYPLCGFPSLVYPGPD